MNGSASGDAGATNDRHKYHPKDSNYFDNNEHDNNLDRQQQFRYTQQTVPYNRANNINGMNGHAHGVGSHDLGHYDDMRAYR